MPTQGSAQSADDDAAAHRQPHLHRAMAESFGSDAARYDRTRPAYPGELIERIVAGRRDMSVLDVGCGTGIGARQLIARGARVLGVEPDARMAAFTRSTGVEVDVSTFEEWDAQGRTFDRVVAAQSWHWVDPSVGAPKAADLLNPGGRIVLFGHIFAPPDDIARATAAALRRHATDVLPTAPDARTAHDGYVAMYQRFADAVDDTGRFQSPEHWRYEWQRRYTRDEWLDLLPTTGSLTRLEPDALAEILRDTAAVIDARGGGFTMDYVTIGVAATKRTEATPR